MMGEGLQKVENTMKEYRTRRCFICERRGFCLLRELEIIRAEVDARIGKGKR